MTPTASSSLPIVGPYLRVTDGVTDGNERKPTVTDSGVRPGTEELDGDARVHFGGRGVPGAVWTALKIALKNR
jgi:hypothetical protein